MYRLLIILGCTIGLLAAGVYILNKESTAANSESSLTVADVMAAGNTAGYARAEAPREFVFPRDHGMHPEFRTEWWYYTGNLQTAAGRHFGYQFTIFRTALSPDTTSRISDWASNQLYMGHFTLSDVESGAFYFKERFSRAGNDLAGVRSQPFRVWLEDWIVSDIGENPDAAMPAMHISARQDDIILALTLRPQKPIVLQGNAGLSQKGPQKGNASYYYSATRLKSTGTVTVGKEIHQVEGYSWMDREWSTSALGDNQAGWDWFSLQLSDNRELMYYQLRKKDGSADVFSKGIIVNADGSTIPITHSQVTLTILDNWKSPLGGAYPARWKLQIPAYDVDLEVTPLLAKQELDVAIRYWEGAVRVAGELSGNGITGFGYVELTGYADGD